MPLWAAPPRRLAGARDRPLWRCCRECKPPSSRSAITRLERADTASDNNGPLHQPLTSTCLRQYKARAPTAPLPMPYSTRARASAVAVPSTRKQPPLSPQRQPLKPIRARLRAPKTPQGQNVSHYCGQPFVELEPVSQSWQPEWPAIRKQVSDNDIGRADVRL